MKERDGATMNATARRVVAKGLNKAPQCIIK